MDDIVAGLLRYYDIPDAHVKDASLSVHRCPKCRGLGRWRSGVHFDHQKICCSLSVTWCPDDIERFRYSLSQTLVNTCGDGI